MLCSGKRVFATCLPIRNESRRRRFLTVVPARRPIHRRPTQPSPTPPPMDERCRKDRPLFVVVGCTGTGKTKLGVNLAKELNGEVVSADSIQVSQTSITLRSAVIRHIGTGRFAGDSERGIASQNAVFGFRRDDMEGFIGSTSVSGRPRPVRVHAYKQHARRSSETDVRNARNYAFS